MTSDTVLKRLKAEVIKQHGLVLQSQATMLIHAMNAGELLLRAKKIFQQQHFESGWQPVTNTGIHSPYARHNGICRWQPERISFTD